MSEFKAHDYNYFASLTEGLKRDTDFKKINTKQICIYISTLYTSSPLVLFLQNDNKTNSHTFSSQYVRSLTHLFNLENMKY